MKGTIIIKSQIKDYCTHFDSFGTCSWEDCFQCLNCDYRITLDNGTIVRDFKQKKQKGKI